MEIVPQVRNRPRLFSADVARSSVAPPTLAALFPLADVFPPSSGVFPYSSRPVPRGRRVPAVAGGSAGEPVGEPGPGAGPADPAAGLVGRRTRHPQLPRRRPPGRLQTGGMARPRL